MRLFDILKRLKKTRSELNILMLGLDCAGKTTMLKKMCGEDVTLVEPTKGFNFKTIKAPKGMKFNISDVGGQKEIRNYWKNYLSGTGLLIWVVDSSDEKRFDEIKLELSLILEDQNLNSIPLMVFANKQDLPLALSPAKVAACLDLTSIHNRPWCIKPTSGIDKTSLDEVLEWIIDVSNKTI